MKQIFIFSTYLIIFILNSDVLAQTYQNSLTESKTEDFSYIDLFPTNNGELVLHIYYSLSYSEQHEQAEWVFYHIRKERILIEAVQRSNDFRIDKAVSTSSATLSDYKKSGYDRGHLAPAADFGFSHTAMSESFYMSNMSPQLPSFNRGIWKKLEALVRNWGSNRNLYIVTGPVLESCQDVIGQNNVCVPEYYYKIIYDSLGQRMIAFLLPNEKGNQELVEYVVDVRSIEQITNIDFFSILPDNIENKLESEINIDNWIW